MVSPLRFTGSKCISEYTPEEEAMFTAYMDVQLEVAQEDFMLPLEQEIVDWLEERL